MSILLKYVASSGNEYNLKGDSIRTLTANYHKWNWGAEGTTLQFGMRVAHFTRAAAAYETTLMFYGSPRVIKDTLNNLHEDFERDVRMMTPGRVYWGSYYINCYISDSMTEPSENNVNPRNTVKIFCPHPFWIREAKMSFVTQEAPIGQTFLDYDYDYDYDYFFGTQGLATWDTGSPFASDFKMTIFGAASNPRVTINGYPYQVNDTIAAGDYIVIDSRANTVTKYLSGGSQVNIFDLRDKTHSVFEPIPGGNLTLIWSGTFGFDLTLYQERSEPREAKVAITRQPVDVSGVLNSYVYLNLTAVNAASYAWQYYNPNTGEWRATTYQGYDTDTLRVKITTTTVNYLWRCVVTGADGQNVISNTVHTYVV